MPLITEAVQIVSRRSDGPPEAEMTGPNGTAPPNLSIRDIFYIIPYQIRSAYVSGHSGTTISITLYRR